MYNLVIAPFIIKQQIFLHLLGSDICSVNRRVVVKRAPSTDIEYEPILDTGSEDEALNIKK
jgi:hypothetical protein